VTAALFVFHTIFSLTLILLILLHRGGGGGLSDMFGGGGASMQGSAMVEKNLTRLTVVAAMGFILTTIGLLFVL
jgi:preprotein translocase subunit SecG